MDKLLSLCVPTNGIVEWVFQVLDSIYNQNINEELYEVVVTDNGSNTEFESLMNDYVKKHGNLIYKKTEAFEFLNQIEAFKLAKGKLIKFINHRSIMQSGSIEYLLDFAKNNNENTFVYFLNGAINKKNKNQELKTFDEFVYNLSIYSSWSTGITMWKKDFENLPQDLVYNNFFPHTSMLFSNRHKEKYLIDNKILLKDIVADASKKGKYNLFYDFAVEYPSILLQLYRDKDITLTTFLKIKKDLYKFLKKLYFEYKFLKRKCSYDLSNADESLNVYFSAKKIKNSMVFLFIGKAFKKVTTKIFRFN